MNPHDTGRGIVLIVDDVPENLSVLHDALDEGGYTVLVATHGEAALTRARQSLPDVVLLDALMPGMDGFEVARRLKAEYATRAIPIIFMTGLTDTEHVVAAFRAGGADYVTKPIRPAEVLARIDAHMQNARQMRQARTALDVFGQATLAIAVRSRRVVWQTPLARKLVQRFFPDAGEDTPAALLAWVLEATQSQQSGGAVRETICLNPDGGRLIGSFHDRTDQDGEGEWLVVLREDDDTATIGMLIDAFRLTQREGEVLYWVTRGKTNRDIGAILGTSPRTVHKHLEHVFAKLAVETRTAAAALAMQRIGGGG